MYNYPNPEFWEIFKKTPGAFSTAEAIALYNICLEVPEGICMELGTHKAKSSMSAALAFKSRDFFLVDPIFTDNEITKDITSYFFKIFEEFSGNLIHFMPMGSLDAIPKFDKYSYVFIDSGSHSDDLPMAETKMLEDKMIQGGIIAYHDLFSQFTKVTEAYEYLLSTGKYEKIEINWPEIFEYVKEHNLEEGNSSWHQYPELPHPPNFVGALRRK